MRARERVIIIIYIIIIIIGFFWVLKNPLGYLGCSNIIRIIILRSLRSTPFASITTVSLDNAMVFVFIYFKLILEELKCYFNVLLYRNNLAKLILEYSSE